MIRTTILALAALVPTLALSAPLTVKGSDTMVVLAQRWAEDFMKRSPGKKVQVTGGGSGTGIAALINGTTDIATASREMKDSEKEKLRTRFNTTGAETSVARDGLTVYVQESNPLEAISLEDLRKVYLGDVSNWKDVGGKDTPIVLYSRENSSGTYVYFKDHVLKGEDFSPRAQTLPGTAAVVNAVSKEPNGIGYGGAAYAKGIKKLKIKTGGGAFDPSAENVKSGKYPLARDLYFYTRNRPSGDTKAFVEYCLSPEGQKIVDQVGYFPIK
jgi:phosphate transport system substrate-binding protein